MHRMWSQLELGPTIAGALKRIARAQENRYRTMDDMIVVMADTSLGEFLPHLGFTRKPQYYRSGMPQGPTDWWEAEHFPYVVLRTEILRAIKTIVDREVVEGGRVHEQISADRVAALWTSVHNSRGSSLKPIKEADVPYYIAYAIAMMPGPAWAVTPDGSAIERILPNWPFRFAPTDHTLTLQLQSLLCIDLISWAMLPPNTIDNPSPVAEIVHISAVGSHTKLRNFTNAVHNNKREIFRLPQDRNGASSIEHVHGRRLDGPGNYNVYYDGPLATSGQTHLVIDHYSVNTPRVGKPFLFLTGLDGLPYWPLFLQLMDIASPFPIEPSWVETVWAEGLSKKCIIELPARGLRAFWVRSDDPNWDGIISTCAGGGDQVVVETFGTIETTLVDGEAGEDDSDDEAETE